MSLLETRLKWQTIVRSGRPAQLKVALLASFSSYPLEPYLGVGLENTGRPAHILNGPFNQIVPECLSPDSQTARFGPQVLIGWARFEELWSGLPWPLADEPERYAQPALETAEACLEAARNWQAHLIFVLPAVPAARPLGLGDAGLAGGVAATAGRAREALRRRLAGQRGVLLLDLDDVLRQMGSARAFNPRLWTVAHVPFSEELFCCVGERLARLVALARQPAGRAFILGGDDTLWGGALDQVGPDGVELGDNGPGEAFRDFQAFLLELRRTGVRLALCSPGPEARTWQVFSRPEMRLKREHLAAWRLGSSTPADSLRQIAVELELNPDQLVFVERDADRLAQVQTTLPQVTCLQMPADPADWLGTLQTAGVLDRLPPSLAELRRAQARP